MPRRAWHRLAAGRRRPREHRHGGDASSANDGGRSLPQLSGGDCSSPVLRASSVSSGNMQWSVALRTTALLVLVLSLAGGLSQARAGDAETIAAINAAAVALDNAFEPQSAEEIKQMVTADHIAVTPYY